MLQREYRPSLPSAMSPPSGPNLPSPTSGGSVRRPSAGRLWTGRPVDFSPPVSHDVQQAWPTCGRPARISAETDPLVVRQSSSGSRTALSAAYSPKRPTDGSSGAFSVGIGRPRSDPLFTAV